MEAMIAVEVPGKLLTRVQLGSRDAEGAIRNVCAKYAALLAEQIISQARLHGKSIPTQYSYPSLERAQ